MKISEKCCCGAEFCIEEDLPTSVQIAEMTSIYKLWTEEHKVCREKKSNYPLIRPYIYKSPNLDTPDFAPKFSPKPGTGDPWYPGPDITSKTEDKEK